MAFNERRRTRRKPSVSRRPSGRLRTGKLKLTRRSYVAAAGQARTARTLVLHSRTPDLAAEFWTPVEKYLATM